MAAIEVEFDVWCSCGSGLDRGVSVEPGNSKRLAQVTIEPCENCLAKARDEGYNDGSDESNELCERSHDAGYDDGYDDGYKAGRTDGISEGAAE